MCDGGAVAVDLTWQTSLPYETADLRHRLRDAEVIRLDDRSWVEFVPDWFPDGDGLLETLAHEAPWDPQRQRVMWDQLVDEPRILARWPDLATLPQPVSSMREALSERYRVDFDLVAVNLYRDGRDSVAWHGDRNRLTHKNPIVVTVSLGERRTFAMRPRGGGAAAISLRLGGGDLMVMLGGCQHEWEHSVPKVARAGARMSVTFRHSEAARIDRPKVT
jgi:alkylated DNA repair dioxygenase AlkB